MRSSILTAALAAALVWGASVQAVDVDVRVVVPVGDIVFEAGIPYYRVTREPVYVVYTDSRPTYYRVVSKKTYKGKSVPPPWAPAYGWRTKDKKLYYGFYDANGVWHWY
jgi:hypothetical protein